MKNICPKSCPSLRHPETGFYRIDCKAGHVFEIGRGHVNTFLFFMKGSCVMDSYEARNHEIEERMLMLCHRDFHYAFHALSDVEVIACRFSNTGGICDVGEMSGAALDKKQEFKALPFRGAFEETLALVSRYIDDGVGCGHMHNSLMQLVFVNLRMYYSLSEQLNLFHYILDRSTSFMALLENNRAKVNNIKELAASMGLSANQFASRFRRHNPGVSPREWFQEKRREEILNDIAYTDLRLIDISEKYGFSMPGNLCAYCKREFGALPSHIRKAYKEAHGEINPDEL